MLIPKSFIPENRFLPTLGLPVLIVYAITAPFFDGLYGQDAYSYYRYATEVLPRWLATGGPFPGFFWPPGFPLIVLLLSRVLGDAPGTAQLVSALAGASVPVMVALLSRETFRNRKDGKSIALVAGLATAFTGQLWQSSVVVMSDTLALASATLGAWSLLRFGNVPDEKGVKSALGWLALATSAISFSVLCRWAYGLLGIPAAVYTLWVASRRSAFHLLSSFLLGTFLTLLIMGVTLPGFFDAILGDDEVVDPNFAGDLQVYKWDPLNAFSRSFEGPDGLLEYRLPNGLYYLLAPAHWFYFSPLLSPFLLIGTWSVMRALDRNRNLILGWAGMVYLFHAGAAWQNFRFTLAYLPPLALILALGIMTAARRSECHSRLFRIYLLAALLMMAASGARLVDRFVERKDSTRKTVEWVEAQTPPRSLLVTFNITPAFRHYSRLEVIELYDLDPTKMEVLLPALRPFYLLLDVRQVETQWRGLAPELNYDWLRRHRRVEELGSQESYRLFLVSPRRVGSEGEPR